MSYFSALDYTWPFWTYTLNKMLVEVGRGWSKRYQRLVTVGRFDWSFRLYGNVSTFFHDEEFLIGHLTNLTQWPSTTHFDQLWLTFCFECISPFMGFPPREQLHDMILAPTDDWNKRLSEWSGIPSLQEKCVHLSVYFSRKIVDRVCHFKSW